MFFTKIDFFPLLIDDFKKLMHLILNKNWHLLLKKKKKKNHCEPLRIPIWRLHVLFKKASAFQKKYKIENRSGGRLSKTHFYSQFSFLSTFLHCDQKNSIFFQKAETVYIEIRLDIFFEIHNHNEKWLEISVFGNSIIRWVYKVVKEALKKSEKIHVVFF